MVTQQYAMVRGRVIRVTKLNGLGDVLDEPGQYAVAKCVTKVTVNDIIEAGNNEVIRDGNDDPALHFIRESVILGHTADIDFLKVDPGIFELVSGNPPVYDWTDPSEIIGFNQELRKVNRTAFGLEVWSYIPNQVCAPDERKWGYTVFPFLKGGHLGGFDFDKGTVNFQLEGAQSRWGSRWGIGPWELIDGYRLSSPISSHTSYRNFIYTGTPPEPTEGIVNFTDVIDNYFASPASQTSDILDGGSSSVTTPSVVEGGDA
jgi:hypothetical protein